MNNFQKAGGVAALVEAGTYLIGMVIAFTVLAPTWDLEPAQYVAFLVDHQTFLHLWHLLIYLVNGVFLIVLVLALHDRLKDGAPAVMQVATAVGLIWAGLVIASGLLTINDLGVVADLYAQDPAQAATVWVALAAVENGLGGAIELPGGLWVLLVSWAALRSGALPRALNYLGFLVGAAGVASALPLPGEPGILFGLGSIFWFIWLGVFLLRECSRQTAVPADKFVPHAQGAN